MAIRKRNNDEYDFSFKSDLGDCLRIKNILYSKDYEIDSLNDCYDLWKKYSNSMASGWMDMDHMDDEEVFSHISLYLDD